MRARPRPKLSRMIPRPKSQDVLISGVFLAWALIEVAVGGVSGPPVVTAVCAVLATIPLGWRRSASITSALCCAGALTLKTALGLPMDGLALLSAVLVAAYSVARHRPSVPALLTVLAMIVLAWLSLFGVPLDERTASTYPFVALWIGAPGIAGAALRVQIQHAERLADLVARAEMCRQEDARLAVQSERDRIARELHDTVAHAVSVMVLHAGAVRSRLPDQLGSEKAALSQAEDAGRQAIVELRQMLGLLRSNVELAGTEPQPTLAQFDRLVEETRRDGLAVDLCIDGDRRPLDSAVEVSAYRILQEALTNVRKHASAQSVSVHVTYDGDWLRLRVADDGVGADGRTQNGYGLVGIRERVEVYGGTLCLSSPPAGGFAVDAALRMRQP